MSSISNPLIKNKHIAYPLVERKKLVKENEIKGKEIVERREIVETKEIDKGKHKVKDKGKPKENNSRTLRKIKWYEQDFDAIFQQRVVKIDGKLCRIFTLGDQAPGTFGVRMRLGADAHIRAVNNLPFERSKCTCDATYAKFHDGMMPPSESNPCWVNLHLHGFWGSSKQDDVYACIKPGQEKKYTYSIAECHPHDGLFIIHPHNFSSSTYISEITSFPIEIYNPKKPNYPKDKFPYQEVLNIVLAYMQKATDPSSGAELEVFDFPKYATSPEFSQLIRASTKLLLTNGSSSPFVSYPIHVPVILRIAFSGLEDTMTLILLDDLDKRVEYTILSIDSMPLPQPKKATEFLLAHMQRIDIMITLDKTTQYRLVKFVSKKEFDDNPASTGTRVLLFINPISSSLISSHLISSHTTGKATRKITEKEAKQNKVTSCSQEEKTCKTCKNIITINQETTNCWIDSINKKFRYLENVAAWRTVLFNHLEFPEMQGAMMDLSVKPAQIVMVANRSEVWIVGADDGTHSYHNHLQWFLILAQRPSPKAKWKRIPRDQQHFQDTLTIVAPQQFLIWLFPFADKRLPPNRRATGKAFVHCHKSLHESAGMMLTSFINPDENSEPSGVGLETGPQSKQILQIVKKSSI